MAFLDSLKSSLKDVHFYLKLIAWGCCFAVIVLLILGEGIGGFFVYSFNIILLILIIQYVLGEKPSPFTGLVYSIIGFLELLFAGYNEISNSYDYNSTSVNGILLLVACGALAIDVIIYFAKDKVCS